MVSTSEVLTAVSSDTKGALAYLDSSKNLFIASGLVRQNRQY